MLLYNVLVFLFLWLGGYAAYMSFNKGLAPNARLQQFLRYFVAALAAIIPLTVSMTEVFQPVVLLILFVAVMWAITYPLTYHLTFRKNSPGYDNQIDIAFSIYLFGILVGLALLPLPSIVIGSFIFVFVFIPFALLIYYMMYHTVIDEKGMMLIQNTDYNETIEFLRSYSAYRVLSVVVVVFLIAITCFFIPYVYPMQYSATSWWQVTVAFVATIIMAFYVWKPNHGLFMRTGVAQLYLLVKDYEKRNSQYAEQQRKRYDLLEVRVRRQLQNPHTILLVIGESASRDFMSAFSNTKENTSPWLKSLSEDREHCVLFNHAYSCDNQTVPTLEKVLTSYNQYDGGDFYTSYSIVDVAKKAGYCVHWYSNQGHLGVADTPITLVANTAQFPKWTQQELNHVQYDESLIDFLKEVNPRTNNLVVLHLMGSHFNYENRFPPHFYQWKDKNIHDNITNYKNTLFYTDHVLQQIYNYGREHLNLQTMVYFSDHADVPDRHRQPNFGGFLHLRIPLAIWIGDEFIQNRSNIAKQLRGNEKCYWTNDLLFDLVCGLLDIESNIIKEENSLTSPNYKFTRENLMAMNGNVNISDDVYEEKESVI